MKRSTYFFAALALQVVVISWVALPRLYVLHTGRTALLRTIPVDPRDPFRGDYVVLNYEVSNAPAGLAKAGDTVFAVLEEKDGFASAKRFTTERPTGGELYLQGRVEERWGGLRVKYGIEAFFVPEGKGLAIERNRNHDVRVRISDRGFAVLEALVRRPGVPPEDESGPSPAAAAVVPASLSPRVQPVREPDGSLRQYVAISGYQSDNNLVAVLLKNAPDDVHDGAATDSFYYADEQDARLLVRLVPLAPHPGRTLTRARLLVAVPTGRAVEIRPVLRTFGIASNNYGRQLEAPTWRSARHGKEKWATPGVLGSPDVGETLSTLEGAAEMQGFDITEAVKGSAGAPHGLVLSWRTGDRPHRRQVPPHGPLGLVALELSWSAN